MLRDPLIIIAAFAVAGVLCGLAWFAWWRPAPTGVVWQDYAWFDPDDEFRSTGMYAVISVPVGVLLGALSTWLLSRDARVTVVAILLGSALAACLMALTGQLLGPESALGVARSAADGAEVEADLRVGALSAWLCFPLGALLGSLVALLSGRDAPRTD